MVDNSIVIDIVFVFVSDMFVSDSGLVISHISDISNNILCELCGLLNSMYFVMFFESIVVVEVGVGTAGG